MFEAATVGAGVGVGLINKPQIAVISKEDFFTQTPEIFSTEFNLTTVTATDAGILPLAVVVSVIQFISLTKNYTSNVNSRP